MLNDNFVTYSIAPYRIVPNQWLKRYAFVNENRSIFIVAKKLLQFSNFNYEYNTDFL